MDDIDRAAMKRGDEEMIPMDVSDADLKDEMNSRTCKSGLTNRQGESCRGTGKIISMPANRQYRENYDKIKW